MDDKYKTLADTLIKQHANRNAMYQGVDDVYYGRWELPKGMPEWVQKVVMMDGHDAVQTAARVMSQYKNLRIKVMPMIADDDNRERANDLEAAMKWNLATGVRRGDNDILHEIAFSAVQYAQTAIQVVYLPYQEKVLEAMGKPNARIKAAKKHGPFAFVSHNPANVYPLYSMYGLEGVLVVRVQKASEFKKEWGKLGNKVIEKSKDNKDLYVTSYDWWDYERRVVWGVENASDTLTLNENAERGVEILDEPNELGFIPFAIRRWGNSLSSNSAERVNPLLKTMWESGQYDMLNVYASMDATLAWKRAAMPIGTHKSATEEPLKLDVAEPVTTVELGPTEEFTPLPPQQVDSRLASQYANFRGMVWQSTVARSLQSLDFPAGMAYSSINQVLDAATSSLSPYKTISEQTIADVVYLMLCWTRYYGDKYETVDFYGEHGGAKAGITVSIPSNTIEPEAVRVEVIMTPDVPLDEQAKANTAVLLHREFNMPQSALLEDMGYENPKELYELRALEDLEKSVVEVEVQRPLRDLEMEYQAQTMQMQMGMQQQMQEQQMVQEQQAMQAQQGAQPITENTGGLGGNPAAGGTPPVQAAPGQAI